MLNIIEHGDVSEIRMARAPVNAFTEAFLQALMATHSEVVERGARGIVLSGREGLFSAGLDVPVLLQRDKEEIQEFWGLFFQTMTYFAESPVPVVAALTGHAPAGGMILGLHCDYRIATRGDYSLGLNEVSLGLPVSRNIFWTLQWVVGSRRAELLASSGALLDPEEALAMGLVDELAAEGEAVAASVAWLEQQLQLPPAAMNRTRLTSRSELLEKISENRAYARIAADAWFSDEAQRGLRALVEGLGKGDVEEDA